MPCQGPVRSIVLENIIRAAVRWLFGNRVRKKHRRSRTSMCFATLVHPVRYSFLFWGDYTMHAGPIAACVLNSYMGWGRLFGFHA